MPLAKEVFSVKLYDISRELFSTPVYPGDPIPKAEKISQILLGDSCNLSGFYTGSHGATHIDAPLHFMEGGRAIDEIPLETFLGDCRVMTVSGILTGRDIDRLRVWPGERILFRGGAFLSKSAAFALGEAGVCLVGTDQPSIAPEDDEEGPHIELLSRGIPLLEGLYLDEVNDGRYTLCAMPLKLHGLEASPVRAVLWRV